MELQDLNMCFDAHCYAACKSKSSSMLTLPATTSTASVLNSPARALAQALAQTLCQLVQMALALAALLQVQLAPPPQLQSLCLHFQ
jgi:hypothetical protein